MVDDCSTDASTPIIGEYAACDAQITALRTDRNSGGPSLPRNMALYCARGRYVAYVDCDDIWLPDKLASQLRFMHARGCNFVYSYYEKVCGAAVR